MHIQTRGPLVEYSVDRKDSEKRTAKSIFRRIIRARITFPRAGEAVLAVPIDVAARIGVFGQAARLSTKELELEVRVAHCGCDVLRWRRGGGFGRPSICVGEGGGGCCLWSGPLERICCLREEGKEEGEECDGGAAAVLVHHGCLSMLLLACHPITLSISLSWTGEGKESSNSTESTGGGWGGDALFLMDGVRK